MAGSDDGGEKGRSERKAPRVPLPTEVTLRRYGYNAWKVKVLDASITGCRVEALERLVEGETVWLKMPGIDSIQARVAWAKDWNAGLEFATPLHPAVFDMLRARLS